MDEAATNDLAAVRAAVMRELDTRPAPRPWWIVAGILVLLQIAVVAMIVTGWSLLFAARTVVGWQTAVLTVAIGVATVVAVRPGGAQALRRGAALTVAAAAVGTALSASPRPHVFTLFGDADCALTELGASLVPALGMLLALRCFAFSRNSALLGGLAVACTGALVLDMTCPIGSFRHGLEFHLLPGAVVAAALVVVRSRLGSRSFVP